MKHRSWLTALVVLALAGCAPTEAGDDGGVEPSVSESAKQSAAPAATPGGIDDGY